LVDKTVNGKEYLRLTYHGESGSKKSCKVWNFNSSKDILFQKHGIIVGKFQKDQYGFRSFPNQIRMLKSKAKV
jgi:hypothetical protein